MESTLVQAQAVSRGADLATVIAWNGYSFQMVGLDVVSYLN